MIKECTIKVKPEKLIDEKLILSLLSKELNESAKNIQHWEVKRRSVDARKGKPMFVLRVRVWVNESYVPVEESGGEVSFPHILHAEQQAVIIGAGPAGLFAALRLIQAGVKPIVIERGKEVRARRRDLAELCREGIVNPESNYCFGEGGAGTFSDGKLYTRSKKRGDVQNILKLFVQFGASRDILIDAHPHIGTNKLPQIIQHIRNQIIASGGEVRFEQKLTDIIIEDDILKGVVINQDHVIPSRGLILATGHSAKDVFHLLYNKQIELIAKPFAMGVRVEHPQPLIDQIQYNLHDTRPPYLPAASYSLVRQVDQKGVFSFCMCPGGIICPAATSNEEIVVNGWSPSKRNSPYANSGIVVEVNNHIDPKHPYKFPLAGLELQHRLEKKAFAAGGGKQVAPAQRLVDFIHKKYSIDLPPCSYLPGVRSTDLHTVLSPDISVRLVRAFKYFGTRLKGFLSSDAIVVGVESRTSTPVRIPRNPQNLMHTSVKGLFPCGEGAGYAGGIMSAAIDGQKCADALIRYYS